MPAVQLGFQFAQATPVGVQPEPASALAPPVPCEGAAELERFLSMRTGTPLHLTITDNRRTMLSVRRSDSHIDVRLHHMFLDGGEQLWDALDAYLFHEDRSAAALIAEFIAEHRTHIRRIAPRRTALITRRSGMHHDLDEIFGSLNARYFGGSIDARITWGREPQHTAVAPLRRSIKLGSYLSRERLIRVHPALDAEFVPRYFVEYIVYHEMLHQVLPPTQRAGRRELHGPDFQAREREFHDYVAALRWERDNLARLLRNRRKRARREL